MKIQKAFLLVFIMSLAGTFLLGAQQDERELTVEELYLKNIEFQILREKAFADDRELKMLVLDDLEKMIDEGSVGEDDIQIELILEYLAMEGTFRRVLESKRLVNYFPEVRRRSANLLGRLGGEEAKDALITVLIKDNEAMVRAEAAYGLGVIGKNDQNKVVEALLYALEQENPELPDNNFAYAVCLALEKIAKASNGIREPEIYRALVRIAQGNYIRTVKRKALQTLDEMKKYQ